MKTFRLLYWAALEAAQDLLARRAGDSIRENYHLAAHCATILHITEVTLSRYQFDKLLRASHSSKVAHGKQSCG
jgi:hypothetical protein